MRSAAGLLLLLGSVLASPALCQTDLLESVKRNPAQAKAMCKTFRQANDNNASAYDKATTRQVARAQQLSAQDAEILITYVVGMHCPDVR